MKFRNLILSLLFVPLVALAQGVNTGGSVQAPSTAGSGVDGGIIYTNQATLPTTRTNGSTTIDYVNVCTGTQSACQAIYGTHIPNTYDDGSGVNSGSFRIGCNLVASGYIDPIAFPGRQNVGHEHNAYGNNLFTQMPQPTSPIAAGAKSSCGGGTANLTMYWVAPPVYYCPAGSTNGCNPLRNGEVQSAFSANFYYKAVDASAGTDHGGYGGTPLQFFPDGLKIIAGDSHSTSVQHQYMGNGAINTYQCFNKYGDFIYYDHIPNTNAELTITGAGGSGPCIDMVHDVKFPQCWDGVNLDSPNHRSHMDYIHDVGCIDPAFPVYVPNIDLNIHYRASNPYDIQYWRLSCEGTNLAIPGGMCGHADWWNGWSNTAVADWGNQTIKQVLMTQCWNVGRSPPMHTDCHDFAIGAPNGDNVWKFLTPPK